jgi:hypothetical protein
MGIPIELIGEKLVHGAVAKFPWWQADGVNHNQVDDGRRGSRAKVGRLAFFSVLAPALLPIAKAHGGKRMVGSSWHLRRLIACGLAMNFRAVATRSTFQHI